MSYQQVIKPDPTVTCIPGACLVYVQDTFDVGPKYPTAIAAWNASQHKHQNELPPPGFWVPGYATISDDKRGHVFDFAPDGSVYSSSSPTSHTPMHHSSLAALISYYGKDASGKTRLSYLGWTEDVEDTLVIKEEVVVKNSIDSERILNKTVLGRNGLDGRPDAFGPDNSAIISSGVLDQEMTPDHIIAMFSSPEGQAYEQWIINTYKENQVLKKQLAGGTGSSDSDAQAKLDQIKKLLG